MTLQESNTVSKESLNALMCSRRSLYPMQFNGHKINDTVINEILEYANMAPTHLRTRPWLFKVFTGPSLDSLIDFQRDFYLSSVPESEVKEKKLRSFEERKEKTSHILAIIMVRDAERRLPEVEEIASVACSVENIYLSLSAYGISGYWGTGNVTYSEEARQYLSLDPDQTLMGFFYMGISKMDIPELPREKIGDKVLWVR